MVQDYYKIGILVMQRPNPGAACFYCIFRDLRRFHFLDITKIKVRSCVLCVYAAAYFAYTQLRTLRIRRHVPGCRQFYQLTDSTTGYPLAIMVTPLQKINK